MLVEKIIKNRKRKKRRRKGKGREKEGKKKKEEKRKNDGNTESLVLLMRWTTTGEVPVQFKATGTVL